MGRPRRQTSETKAEMEGSSEDSEPHLLESFAKDLKHSIIKTQSALEHHL
jgi:hypothetical protein